MKWLLTAGVEGDAGTPRQIEKALDALGITVYFTDFAETQPEHFYETRPGQ